MVLISYLCVFMIYMVASFSSIKGQSSPDDDSTNMCGERMEKLKEFYCVSQCIGVSEMVDMQMQAGRLIKASKSQPMSPTVRCANLDISGPGVKDCCVGPMPEMFFEDKNNAFRTDCAKASGVDDKQAVQYLTEYMLHRWQDNDNVFDILLPSNLQYHKVFCFVECIFLKPAAKWLSDSKIITNNLRNSWKTAAGAKYGEVMTNAIDACFTIVDTMLQVTSVTVNNKQCSTAPLIFLQCVRKSMILGCSPNAGKSCNVMANMRSCNFFE